MTYLSWFWPFLKKKKPLLCEIKGRSRTPTTPPQFFPSYQKVDSLCVYLILTDEHGYDFVKSGADGDNEKAV